jgi:outer membrane protein assembly factor BamE (lipoprotein component of BamABCDE complex)
MRSTALYVVLLLASVGLTSCDDIVFSHGEVLAKRKYESVKKGESRDAVVRALGSPAFELVFDRSRMTYTYRDESGKNVELEKTWNARSGAPIELQFLPENFSASRVLVYSAGTVFGYVGLADDNTVSAVKVIVS